MRFVAPVPEQIGTPTMHFSKVAGGSCLELDHRLFHLCCSGMVVTNLIFKARTDFISVTITSSAYAGGKQKILKSLFCFFSDLLQLSGIGKKLGQAEFFYFYFPDRPNGPNWLAKNPPSRESTDHGLIGGEARN